jgi:hypothetical protein
VAQRIWISIDIMLGQALLIDRQVSDCTCLIRESKFDMYQCLEAIAIIGDMSARQGAPSNYCEAKRAECTKESWEIDLTLLDMKRTVVVSQRSIRNSRI